MNLIEQFTTKDELETFYKKILHQSFLVDEYYYFGLHISQSYSQTEFLENLKQLYTNYSDELKNNIQQKIHASYIDFVTSHATHNTSEVLNQLQSLTQKEISEKLQEFMVDPTSPPVEITKQYIYPYSKTTFNNNVMNNVVPSLARKILEVLAENGYISVKKSYILFHEKEITEEIFNIIKENSSQNFLKTDFNKILKDSLETTEFYKEKYYQLCEENKNLCNTIDSLSEKISNQSLTRWY